MTGLFQEIRILAQDLRIYLTGCFKAFLLDEDVAHDKSGRRVVGIARQRGGEFRDCAIEMTGPNQFSGIAEVLELSRVGRPVRFSIVLRCGRG